jgi:HAD superfamily phosphoserine phosphatase-like hydrolase
MKAAEEWGATPRLIAFDMDGTLLSGRVIYTLAQRLGFSSELEKISRAGSPKYVRSKNVAKLLAGLRVSEFTEAVEGMQLMEGAAEAIEMLRDKKYIIGIISDSYTLATGIVARKLKMDFHFANTLAVRDDVITGELSMPMGWEKIGCSCGQSVCKRYHLVKAAGRYEVETRDTVAVGDSEADSCMIGSAGVGIWFNAAVDDPIRKGGFVVKGRDLRLVSAHLTGAPR